MGGKIGQTILLPSWFRSPLSPPSLSPFLSDGVLGEIEDSERLIISELT